MVCRTTLFYQFRLFSKIACTAALIFCASLGISQSILQGRILDGATAEPIPFANIFFKNTPSFSTLSDVNGNFSLPTTANPDTIIVSAGGYSDLLFFYKPDQEHFIQLFLKEDQFNLGEVIVTARKEDPAYEIVRKVIRHKKSNHKNSLPSYTFETYKKLKFGIKNVDDQFKTKKFFKPFSFIFENIDSTEEEPYLPVFFTETLSDIYYSRNAGVEKEVVTGTQSSGLPNASITSLFDDLSGSFYIYEDYLPLCSKNFFSPIAGNCFSHYRYELLDSTFYNLKKVYKIKYWPKHQQELTFAGLLWVSDSVFDVKEVSGNLQLTANLNFITSLSFHQQYTKVGHASINLKDQLVINGEFFIPHEMRSQKFIAKKYSSNSDFNLQDSLTADFFKGPEKIFSVKALHRDPDFWTQHRHDSLTNNESAIFHLVDSVKNIPLFKNYLAVFTGYRSFGKIDIGPYYKIYSYNPVEGNRIRLGFRTRPQLSSNYLVDGYGAYGLRDKKAKFGLSYQFFFRKDLRRLAGVSLKHDVEQLGFSQIDFRRPDNFLSTIFKIYPYNKLNRVDDGRIFIDYEIIKGISARLNLKRSIYSPAGKLKYERALETGIQTIDRIHTTEISMQWHLSKDEKYLNGDYNRVSLGSPFPTFDILFASSLPGLGSDYTYQRGVLQMEQKIKFKKYGFFNYRMEAGKFWGIAPFPLLELHNGNQTWFYDGGSFNTMNFFEFVSDTYITGFTSYHMDGLILDRIPLIRKLKWREVFTMKGVYGSLKTSNKEAMILPANMYVPDHGFYEAGAGLENIFRFFRLDALWRISYLDHSGIHPFVVKGSFQFSF